MSEAARREVLEQFCSIYERAGGVGSLEVVKTIRDVLDELVAWQGKWNATLDRETRWIERLKQAETERDALRAEMWQRVDEEKRLREVQRTRADKVETALREVREVLRVGLSNRGAVIASVDRKASQIIDAALRDTAPEEKP
jgi:predicted nuclease with TOPRIM domain